MTQIGQCHLCLNNGVELVDSHVIPKWAYRWIVQRTPNERNPVLVRPGKAYTSSKQRKAYLLCKPCEDLIGTSETYVASRLRQGNGIRSFNKTVVELPVCFSSKDYCLVGLGDWDTDRLVYFASSILWRWHIYPYANEKLVLDAQYGEAFRQYLLGLLPFPLNSVVVLHCFEDQPGGVCKYEEMITEPVSVSNPGYNVHFFFLCGMRFIFAVGQHIPREYKDYCLVRGKISAVAMMTPTSELISLVVPLVAPIIAKTGGLLRKRSP